MSLPDLAHAGVEQIPGNLGRKIGGVGVGVSVGVGAVIVPAVLEPVVQHACPRAHRPAFGPDRFSPYR